jgi:hypothetical protein
MGMVVQLLGGAIWSASVAATLDACGHSWMALGVMVDFVVRCGQLVALERARTLELFR